nr:RAMP superfamily CRISPR-associated protein [Clostridium novyi]
MYVIPSSTIKGIVHSYCKKIILTLGKNVQILDDIFGEKTNEREKKEGKRGNLIFNDYKISEDRLKKCKSIYNRIKIDRFTGGAFQGNIFRDEVIIFNEETQKLEFKVSISNKLKSREYGKQKLFEKAIALIILTFRDMGLGYVTLGSGNNVGLGRLQGNFIIIKDNCNEYKVQFNNGELVAYNNRHSDVKKFEEYIKALNE